MQGRLTEVSTTADTEAEAALTQQTDPEPATKRGTTRSKNPRL